MSGYRVHITGYRLDKNGRLVPCFKRLNVSLQLKKKRSKRVRPAKCRVNL